MAKYTKIEWTMHTFNPWWGCIKVSPACDNCYAESIAKRVGQKVWGLKSARRLLSDAHWDEPLKWQSEAAKSGTRPRVFCASMADVFEARSDLNPLRKRLWTLIEATPNLDWLLLTKRPQYIAKLCPWAKKGWPKNVWLGTTVENQEMAEKRLPHLLKHGAAVRFLSCEPLLGPIDLGSWNANSCDHPIDWLIAGGESGPKSRPMQPDWVRSLRDQCLELGISFFFKQWGAWAPARDGEGSKRRRVEFGKDKMAAFGLKSKDRRLDGEHWEQIPKISH